MEGGAVRTTKLITNVDPGFVTVKMRKKKIDKQRRLSVGK